MTSHQVLQLCGVQLSKHTPAVHHPKKNLYILKQISKKGGNKEKSIKKFTKYTPGSLTYPVKNYQPKRKVLLQPSFCRGELWNFKGVSQTKKIAKRGSWKRHPNPPPLVLTLKFSSKAISHKAWHPVLPFRFFKTFPFYPSYPFIFRPSIGGYGGVTLKIAHMLQSENLPPPWLWVHNVNFSVFVSCCWRFRWHPKKPLEQRHQVVRTADILYWWFLQGSLWWFMKIPI